MRFALLMFGLKFAICLGLFYFVVRILGQDHLAWHETLTVSAVLALLVALAFSLGQLSDFVAAWRAGSVDVTGDREKRR